MPRSSKQKLKLLYVMDFLLRQTDEEHPASLAQLQEHLEANGIAAERKSLYDDMEALRAHYEKQLNVYALALERITGMRVKQRLLCLLESGGSLELGTRE